MDCAIFSVMLIHQVTAIASELRVAGRVIVGLGVGFVSANVIPYMSEIVPQRFRGAITSGY